MLENINAHYSKTRKIQYGTPVIIVFYGHTNEAHSVLDGIANWKDVTYVDNLIYRFFSDISVVKYIKPENIYDGKQYMRRMPFLLS